MRLSPDFFRKFGIYGGGLFFMITGMAQPFFSLYAQEVGASTAAIGFMVMLRGLFPIFIAMPSGQLIDSIGPIKMLKIGTVLLILSMFTTFSADGIWMLSVSQLFLGSSMVIMTSSLQVLVSSGDKNTRNENIKRFSTWQAGCKMIGPLAGGAVVAMSVTELFGYRMSFLFSGIGAVLFLIVLLVVSRGYDHPDPAAAEVKPRDLLRMSGLVNSYTSGLHLTKNRKVQFGLFGTFLIIYIQALFVSFMPLYLKELGYAVMTISILIAVKDLAGMIARYALGWIMKRLHLEAILVTAGTIAAACVILLPLAGVHMATVILLILVMGGALGINMPVSIMIMVNDNRESDRGKLMGIRLLVNRVSQISGSALFGMLGHGIGLTAAFYSSGIFLVATMLGFTAFTSMKWNLKTEGLEQAEADGGVRSQDRLPAAMAESEPARRNM